MTVYLIQCGEQPFVKIGWAEDDRMRTRLQTLQAAHFEILHVIRTVPGFRHTERQFHDRFRRWHVRREWYQLQSDMLTFKPELEPTPDTSNFAYEQEQSRRRLAKLRVQ